MLLLSVSRIVIPNRKSKYSFMKDNNHYSAQPPNQSLGHIAGNDDWSLFGEAQFVFKTFLYHCVVNTNNCTQPGLGAE